MVSILTRGQGQKSSYPGEASLFEPGLPLRTDPPRFVLIEQLGATADRAKIGGICIAGGTRGIIFGHKMSLNIFTAAPLVGGGNLNPLNS